MKLGVQILKKIWNKFYITIYCICVLDGKRKLRVESGKKRDTIGKEQRSRSSGKIEKFDEQSDATAAGTGTGSAFMEYFIKIEEIISKFEYVYIVELIIYN